MDERSASRAGRNPAELRSELVRSISGQRDRLVELCRRMVGIDSQNPPGDTYAMAAFIEDWVGAREDVEVRRVVGKEPAVNLVIRMVCGRPGRRLVINGHMDTFPAGDPALWSVPPLKGTLRDGRIYGRGVSDMKAGLAATLMAFDLLWSVRGALAGELVLTLVADEETDGAWGTGYLLDNVPEASGDAMLNADAGAPEVARFGEKGQMWLAVRATGRAAHGAHVHLGDNAILRLIDAITRIRRLEDHDCPLPASIDRAITAAAGVSERISGEGEQRVLRSLTVNVGVIEGGAAVNMVPDRAAARLDIRFPPGMSVADVSGLVDEAIAPVDGLEAEVLSSCEPYWTDPAHEIVRLVTVNGGTALGAATVANMRVGFSDARYYRQRGIPAVVYGPAPYNMGAPDEHVTIKDLEIVHQVLALSEFDYLART